MSARSATKNPLKLTDRLALRTKEAAATLGISERKLRQIQHTLPRVVLDGVILFPVSALERWLERQAVVDGDRLEAAVDDALRTLSKD